MPSNYSNPRDRAKELMNARHMVRLWDGATRTYLHLSGNGTTPEIGLSWLGFAYQARELERRARARGEDWPFRTVARDLTEGLPEIVE